MNKETCNYEWRAADRKEAHPRVMGLLPAAVSYHRYLSWCKSPLAIRWKRRMVIVSLSRNQKRPPYPPKDKHLSQSKLVSSEKTWGWEDDACHSCCVLLSISTARINSSLIMVDVRNYTFKEDQPFHAPGRVSSQHAHLRYCKTFSLHRIIYLQNALVKSSKTPKFLHRKPREKIEIIEVHRAW